MAIDPAIFRVLVEQGATPEMLLAVVEADARADEARREEKRAGNAARQARYRQRHGSNVSNALCGVTERDGLADPSLDKESFPQTPFKEIKPIPGVCETRAHEDELDHRLALAANRLWLACLVQLCTDAKISATLHGAISVWNAMAERAGLSSVKRLTPERRARLRARLAEHGPDAFTEAIAAIERSSFCRGDSDRGWRADFDFLLQPKSFNRLIEGSYDRQSPAPRTSNNHARNGRGREDPIFAARRNIGRDDIHGRMEPPPSNA